MTCPHPTGILGVSTVRVVAVVTIFRAHSSRKRTGNPCPYSLRAPAPLEQVGPAGITWGNIWGDIWGNLWGNIWGIIWGDIWGNTWGNIWRDIWAKICGNTPGNP